MKPIFITIFTLALISASPQIYAAKNETGGTGTSGTGAGSSQTVDTNTNSNTTTIPIKQNIATPAPAGNTVKNTNQVQTKNAGEDSQLQVNTQEQESLGDSQDQSGASKSASPRSQNALENMSIVSQKVEELLTSKTLKGGIGDQVKVVAQNQKQTQDQIQSELKKIDDRGKFTKKLIGPDFKALKNMQQQVEQNQLRIQELEQLMSQLTNKGQISEVEETIQALTAQNVALQDRIKLEENTSSLLGWLFKFLNK